MILVVSNRADAHVEPVLDALRERQARWVRLDTDRYPHDVQFLCGPSGTSLLLDEGLVELCDVSAVWWRRPLPPRVHREDAAVARWASREAYAALDSGLRTIRGLWVNHPDANRAAENKAATMRLASEIGLAVPDWVITNRISDALDFNDLHAGHIVLKSLHAGHIDDRRALFTAAVTARDHLLQIGPEPAFLQRQIEKRDDIRVVVVGDQITAVAIDSQSDARSVVDMRAGDLRSLAHRLVKLPEEIQRALLKLTKCLDLRFAAVDLIRDEVGAFWFLEINPNGQWAWLQEKTGSQIAGRLAELLQTA